jgi:hypothetical protein
MKDFSPIRWKDQKFSREKAHLGDRDDIPIQPGKKFCHLEAMQSG